MLVGHQDSTTLEYIIWGYVICQVYKKNPQSISDLKEDIIQVISKIKAQCQNAEISTQESTFI